MMHNRYLEHKSRDGRRTRRDMHYASRRPEEYFRRAREHSTRMNPGYRGEVGQEYYKHNPGIDFRYKDNDRIDYRDSRRDYNDYNRESYQYPPMHTDSRDYRDYGDYNMNGGDYRDYGDYGDYGDYDMTSGKHSEEEKWQKDLERWIEKLKRKDRFNQKMEDVIGQAKQMGVKFDQFSEEEFYATYLMMVSDYKTLSNEPRMYMSMAKEWLMDDDIETSPSEKLCIYFYEIVKGEGLK